MTHENINITDLSDPYKPIKIAERYTELYENEWRDALKELTKLTNLGSKDEQLAVKFLLDICMVKKLYLCHYFYDK